MERCINKILIRLLPLLLIVSTSAAANSMELDKAIKIYYAGLPNQAISLIKPLALSGDVNAQFLLGNILYSLSKTNKKSEIDDPVKWYKMAAANNSPDANYALGVIYNNKWTGSLRQEHLIIAKFYFENAAALGHLNAQVYLAEINNRDEASNQKKSASNAESSPGMAKQVPQIPVNNTQQSGSTDPVSRASGNTATVVVEPSQMEDTPRQSPESDNNSMPDSTNLEVSTKQLPANNDESESISVNLADIATQCKKYTRAGFNYYADSIKGATLTGTAIIDTIGSSPSRPGAHLIRLTNSKYDTLLFITLDGVPKEVAKGLKEEGDIEIMGIVEDSQIIGSNCDVILTYQLGT